MEFVSHTLDLVGKIMIFYTAIAVHYRVRKEHKIDKSVFHAMRREQGVGILGIVLIIIAYLIRLPLLV